MRVLFLPNWRVEQVKSNISNKQSPDIYVKDEKYWFFKHWPISNLNVRIIDCGMFGKIEKKLFKIHIFQAFIAFFVASKYDLIISHGGQSALMLAILRKMFFRKHPPHLLVDIAAINGGDNRQPVLAITQFAATKLDKIVYHAKMQENHYKQYFPKLLKNSCFIPFGVDINFFKPSSLPKERNYILSFGYRFRDWNTLISAYNIANIKTKLVIIGPGSIDTPLPPNVILHSSVPISALKALINNSKFVIIPLIDKKYAHGQMSVLQTMAFAKPVITADTGAITDYIQHEKDALLYLLGDSNSLSEQIVKLENNPDLRKRIGQQGAWTVRNKFNEEKMGQLIWQAVKPMLANDVENNKEKRR